MTPPSTADGDPRENGELEFFGVKLKVKNPRLAALLNSSVNEDVQVIGARAREAFSGADDARAEREVEERVQHADDSVHIRLDGVEDV
jgi:hypothetical protein